MSNSSDLNDIYENKILEKDGLVLSPVKDCYELNSSKDVTITSTLPLKSACCNADVLFIGALNMRYRCGKCRKACDII